MEATSSKMPSNRAANDQLAQMLANIFAQWEDEDWKNVYDLYKLMHQNPGRSGQEYYTAGAAENFLKPRVRRRYVRRR